jgi:hypothetical protein
MNHPLLTAVFALSAVLSQSAVASPLMVVPANQTNIQLEKAGSPESAARHYLMSSSSALGLRSDLSDLITESVTETPAGYSVRFQQMSNGLPIENANVVVTLSRSLQVLTYVNDYARSANGFGLEKFSAQNFQLSEDNALERAYQELKLRSSPSAQTVQKKMLVEAGSLRSVYQVQLAAPADGFYAWEIIMDAVDGRIYKSRDLAVHSRPASRGVVTTGVFDPNPTIRSGKASQGLDANNADSTFYSSMMTQVSLDNLTQKNGKYQLVGPNVVIADSEAPKNPDCSFSSDALKLKRSDACFDAVNVYYFIDKTMKYMNGTLGFNVHPLKYQGGIKVDPHGLNGEDNSHYNPMSDELAFGEGGIDDAQDHDVIIHELGHAIHNWVTKGHLSQVEGLSEGSGDYWAASYDRQFMKPDNIAYNWTFSFDGHNEFWPGRVVNVTKKYPAGAKGEIHDAGQLWATTCIEVYDAIGKEKADKLFWTALASLNESSSQADAAKAYVVAAQQLYPSDLQTVISKFKARGYPVR